MESIGPVIGSLRETSHSEHRFQHFNNEMGEAFEACSRIRADN